MLYNTCRISSKKPSFSHHDPALIHTPLLMSADPSCCSSSSHICAWVAHTRCSVFELASLGLPSPLLPPPPSVSPWRWGPSAVSWVSCEHRWEGRDAFQRQRRSRAGEPWQQGETQTQQPTTPNRKSHSTYLSGARLTALSLLPKCHFPLSPLHPPLPGLLWENGWENWAGWRWRSTLLQSCGIMFSSPSDLFLKWAGDAACSPLGVRALVTPLGGRKVVLNRAERERTFGRILTERGARPPGGAVVGAGGALPVTAPLELNSELLCRACRMSAPDAGVGVKRVCLWLARTVKGETLQM